MPLMRKLFALGAMSCLLTACDPYSRFSEMSEANRARFIAAEKACRVAVEIVVEPTVLSRTDWDSGGDPNNNSVGVRFFARNVTDQRFWFCEVYPDGTVFRLTVGTRNDVGAPQQDLLSDYRGVKGLDD